LSCPKDKKSLRDSEIVERRRRQASTTPEGAYSIGPGFDNSVESFCVLATPPATFSERLDRGKADIKQDFHPTQVESVTILLEHSFFARHFLNS